MNCLIEKKRPLVFRNLYSKGGGADLKKADALCQ